MERLVDTRLVQRLVRTGQQPVMQIDLEGEVMDQWLPGASLEAVFRASNGACLVFSVDDCPYEEGLNIVLLSSEKIVLDVKSIVHAYATGHLHDLRIEGPRTVSFSFYDSERWRATVSPGPLRRRPKWIPRRLWRGLQVRRLAS